MNVKKLLLIYPILILVLILVIISLVINNKKIEIVDKQNNISNNTGSGLINNNLTSGNKIKVFSIGEIYDNLIVKNNLDKKINRDIFSSYLSQFNSIDKKLPVFQIYTFGKVEIYPKDEKSILNFFKNNFNQNLIIEKYVTNDLVLSSDLNIKYKNDYDNYTFYNEKSNYFFNIKKVYEMNGVCSLVFGKLNSFKDFNGEEVKVEYDYSDSFDLLKKGVEMHGKNNIIPEKLYEKALNSKDIDSLTNKKLLYTIASKYIETKDNKYLDLFYKKFYSNFNKDYSYEEYSLFLEFKNIQGAGKSYCDTFNKEFFLGM